MCHVRNPTPSFLYDSKQCGKQDAKTRHDTGGQQKFLGRYYVRDMG